MKSIRLFALLVIFALIAGAVMAHGDPAVVVSDQVSLNGTVTVSAVHATAEAFIVIHKANDEGGIGPVIGYRQVNKGHSNNVVVAIDVTQATTTLFAMLHNDTGEIGVYEFGTVEGADGPVRVNDAVVSPAFNVELVRAYDQLVDMNTVTIANVVTAQDGWMVIHADNGEGRPGPVIGYSPVTAGANADVVVELSGDATPVIFPMLHVDTGTAGTYEFGTVEGADGPVRVNDRVATFPITVGHPSMRVAPQIVTTSVTAESVVSEGAGFLVIHADNGEGRPGPVIGYSAVSAGTNMNVVVEIDAAGLTPVLFPMLHVDTGVEGTYEFGQVEGADGPVRVNDAVLTYAIAAAPSIVYQGTLNGTILTVDAALIDAQGWLVIHADNGEGRPGPVLGSAPLIAGWNTAIGIELTGDVTETLFPMLHVDSGELGEYEFGSVEGADGPVRVNDVVVTGPMVPAGE